MGSNNTANAVVDQKKYYGTNNGDEKTGEVQSRHARTAKGGEQPSADHCTNDSQNDIEENSFTSFVYDLAA